MMAHNIIARFLSAKSKRALKSYFNEARSRLLKALFRYDGETLGRKLTQFGIKATDTLLVHVNFEPDSGFQGTPLDLANAFVELVGTKGNLLMVSLPFRGSAYDYLAQGKPFNAKKTMSMMGLVTEMFRRRPGTLRSLHPTHPVLACGKDAAWLVADHERCLYPCGAGSPFEKFYQLKGKILFFDVTFRSITFFHFVEDLLKDRLPFPVYSDRLFTIPAVDANGGSYEIQTCAFNKDVRRLAGRLETEMARKGMIRYGRVGNSRFCLATTEDVVACFTAMVEAGNPPLELAAGGTDGKDQDDE